MVPVHHYHVDIGSEQQQSHELVNPHRRRARGSIPVDDEGGGSGQIKAGVRREVGVGQEGSTAAVLSGVQQESDPEARAQERMTDVQVSEFITSLSWRQKKNKENSGLNCGAFTFLLLELKIYWSSLFICVQFIFKFLSSKSS